jgi:hypothetical protein
MPFDSVDKKYLANQITGAIENMVQPLVLQANLKDEIKISEHIDFNFGWAIGFIERGFYLYHTVKYGDIPSEEEDLEILREIQNRLVEIREASNF